MPVIVMDDEENIDVVMKALMNDKAREKNGVAALAVIDYQEKIGVVPAAGMYDVEKRGIVSEALMNHKPTKKIGALKKDILEGRKTERV